MLIELTGVPCCGKSYYIKNNEGIRVLLRKKTLFAEFLFLIKGIKYLNSKEMCFFFINSMKEKLPFIYKLNIFRNILRKFGVYSTYNKQGNLFFVDEGVSHILFNLLEADIAKVFCYLKPHLKLVYVRYLPVSSDGLIKKRLIDRGHSRLVFENVDDFIDKNRKVEAFILSNYPAVCKAFEEIEND